MEYRDPVVLKKCEEAFSFPVAVSSLQIGSVVNGIPQERSVTMLPLIYQHDIMSS